MIDIFFSVTWLLSASSLQVIKLVIKIDQLVIILI